MTLIIYTITGQHVATVVSGRQEPGHYEVVWDASGLGNGIYFYRLEAGTFVHTKRMVIVNYSAARLIFPLALGAPRASKMTL